MSSTTGRPPLHRNSDTRQLSAPRSIATRARVSTGEYASPSLTAGMPPADHRPPEKDDLKYSATEPQPGRESLPRNRKDQSAGASTCAWHRREPAVREVPHRSSPRRRQSRISRAMRVLDLAETSSTPSRPSQ